MTTSERNILIVDDTPINLKLLMNILTQSGYEVRPATSGKQAVDAMNARLPDLVLLDIAMPEMDGYEVCQRLKQDPATEGVPIIFLSAAHEVMDKVRAFQVGGTDYITKPFQVEEVLATPWLLQTSSRDRRAARRLIETQLECVGISRALEIADLLIDIGIYQDITPFLGPLQHPESFKLLEAVYGFTSIHRSNQMT